MLTILLLALAIMQARTAPLGPEATPTMVHTILFKRQTPCECSGTIERTLVDIIRSCVLTIAACVYRAIHQNIPDPNASWLERQWGRVKIMLFALLAPEAVLWWAMRQWQGATMIADKVNQIKPELKWTRTHGHFLQMGGFGRKDNEKIIHPPTFINLLRSGEIDIDNLRQVSKKRILDQSKGDALSKGVVALQTTWFVFECVARVRQKLQVTELEVVTLAFAVLNGFMYYFWWDKPLDVLCTVYIDVHPPTATSGPSLDPVQSPPPNTNTPASEADRLVNQDPPARPTTSIDDSGIGLLAGLTRVNKAVRKLYHDAVRQIKESIDQRGWWILYDWFIFAPLCVVIRAGMDMYLVFGGLIDDHTVDDDAIHIPTFYAIVLADERSWIPYLASFAGTVFGAVHFVSWDSPFPTHTEQLLWRISTAVLTGALPSIGILGFIGDFFGDIKADSKEGSWWGTIAGFLSNFLAIVALLLIPLFYIFARFCVLVLALVTLSDLPPDAFRVVSWTSYIPHF